MAERISQNIDVIISCCRYYAMSFNLDGDELQQEVVLRLLRFPESYTPTNSFRTFVSRVAKNICIDIFRRSKIPKRFNIPVSVEKAHGSASVYFADDWTERELAARIYSEIRRKFGHKHAIMIYMLSQGYKYEDTADKLGIPVGTLKARVFKVRVWMTKFKPLV